MSNFKFLYPAWPGIYAKLKKAEERVYSEPVSSAGYGRMVLEECIHLIYEFESLEMPFNSSLVELIGNAQLQAIVPQQYMSGLAIIRKTGNSALHYGNKVQGHTVLVSLMYMFDFVKWFAHTYTTTCPPLPEKFDENFVPKEAHTARKAKEQELENEAETKKLAEELDKLRKKNEELLAKAKESEISLNAYREKIKAARQKAEENRKKRAAHMAMQFNEAQTRTHLIDADLHEAGWHELRKGYELEFPVKGMPLSSQNPHGNGYADYVLWADNGKPLAVIEAKRTSAHAENGKYQAFLYANCLEQMYKQRPVIFYTNGFETYIWDDVFYSAPRRVYGFYTKTELEWLIQQRSTRTDARLTNINPDIVDRSYQIEAIRRIAEAFVAPDSQPLKGAQRKALLVMATGSGKTRVAAALVDVLYRSRWVKRVLFLADRITLVKQAKTNFNEYLPDYTSVNLTEEEEQGSTRLVFSTYPTIMNKIDQMRSDDGRYYGVGHFDLIILDEAHRSVYNKYQAIFEYFDALVVGLTATPKESIDHNTYELLGCSAGDPTFEYNLADAVPKFLAPFRTVYVETGFMREGIQYNQLSEEERQQYEDTFANPADGTYPEEIDATALNKWLFNKDTVFKVLDVFMSQCLKIEGGDKIGRTIIFAVNQKHAAFIVECFLERYPHYPAGYIMAIHNQVSHAQTLIEAFQQKYVENMPQIAVSVDMLDTGVDAPRVLNLVFFKIVRSYAKFWQMIGRGTRLCPDIFGPEQDKEYFKIFDVCGNFHFFNQNTQEEPNPGLKSLSQQLFEARLQVSNLLAITGLPENVELANQFRNMLHASIQSLNKDRFEVKMVKQQVEDFKKRERWDNLSVADMHTIENQLAHLPVNMYEHERIKRFDLLMLKLMHARLLKDEKEIGYREKLVNISSELSHKYTIPEVLNAKGTIEPMKESQFYKDLTHKRLEEIRQTIRNLVKYLDAKEGEVVYTNFEDSVSMVEENGEMYGKPASFAYKTRVERFLRENKDHITISKLRNNQPITSDELTVLENMLFDAKERGTRADYEKEFGKQPLGKFVRSILGLKSEAANQAFSGFIQAGNLSSDQMTFINTIIDFLTKNGTIDKQMLFEQPFTNANDNGLIGIFDDVNAGRIISIIDNINSNANVG